MNPQAKTINRRQALVFLSTMSGLLALSETDTEAAEAESHNDDILHAQGGSEVVTAAVTEHDAQQGSRLADGYAMMFLAGHRMVPMELTFDTTSTGVMLNLVNMRTRGSHQHELHGEVARSFLRVLEEDGNGVPTGAEDRLAA